MPDRFDEFARRWEFDGAFRRRLHILISIITIASIVFLIGSGYMIAEALVPWLFNPPVTSSSSMVQAGSLSPNSQVGFAISTVTPHDRQVPTAYPVQQSTAPTPTPTVTPPPNAPPGCPSLTGTPAFTGGGVRDATLPAPLRAGCPALILIQAPAYPNAPITLSLSFGVLSQIMCSISNFSSHTDSAGNAAIVVIVPPATCFHGTTITSGLITVDGDASANANLYASD